MQNQTGQDIHYNTSHHVTGGSRVAAISDTAQLQELTVLSTKSSFLPPSLFFLLFFFFLSKFFLFSSRNLTIQAFKNRNVQGSRGTGSGHEKKKKRRNQRSDDLLTYDREEQVNQKFHLTIGHSNIPVHLIYKKKEERNYFEQPTLVIKDKCTLSRWPRRRIQHTFRGD